MNNFTTNTFKTKRWIINFPKNDLDNIIHKNYYNTSIDSFVKNLAFKIYDSNVVKLP